MAIDAFTKDGRSGTLHIAGMPYDLADGRLFLISTQDATPRVLQVQCELTELKGIRGGPVQTRAQRIAKFAEQNETVRKFWTDSAKP